MPTHENRPTISGIQSNQPGLHTPGLLHHPRFPEIGVIGMVPDLWQSPWQPRHHVLSRLAEWFHVVWAEPAQEWRKPRQSQMHSSSHPSNFEVYAPEWWLPKIYKPHRLATQLDQIRVTRAYQRLKRRGCRKIVLYLWRPEYAYALAALPHDMSCYHIDDEYSFSPGEQPICSLEHNLLQRVDQVIIHSVGLFEKKGQINPNTILVPNGVDFSGFCTPVPEPPDLAAIPQPRVGYIGYLKPQLDFRLLLNLAQRHREWSFVFIGPRGYLEGEDLVLIDRLQALPHVHFLGSKPVETLPAYAQGMKVSIMPYKLNDYTKYIFPMKLHEYLATGRPVVGSPIRSLQQFQDVVALPTTEEEWSQALTRAMHPESMAQIALRRQTAQQYDWTTLVARIANRICTHLGKPCVDTLHSSF